MKRMILAGLLALLVITPLAVSGERDCGRGLPCGPLPWALPQLPILLSPTPMPTVNVTIAPTQTPVPTQTPGPSATPGTPTLIPEPTGGIISDFTELGDQISTLAAMVNATDVPVEISGTPVDTNEQIEQMAETGATFFGYIRGFSEVNLGGLTPFITFAVVSFAVVIGVKATTYLLPVAVAIFGIILKVISFVAKLLGA